MLDQFRSTFSFATMCTLQLKSKLSQLPRDSKLLQAGLTLNAVNLTHISASRATCAMIISEVLKFYQSRENNSTQR